MKGIIAVRYRCTDGIHVFTAEEPCVAGLCVASLNLKDAYAEVTEQLNTLQRKNNGISNPNYKPELPFEQFKAWLDDLMSKAPAPVRPIPAAHIQWR
jgi:hypothetical protein